MAGFLVAKVSGESHDQEEISNADCGNLESIGGRQTEAELRRELRRAIDDRDALDSRAEIATDIAARADHLMCQAG